jgi:di/tricarboxylate transporter
MSGALLFTTAVVFIVLAVLIFTEQPTDLVLFAAVLVLLLAGIIDRKEALAGFANDGMITVGALFVVAGGLRSTGAVHKLSAILLGAPSSDRVSLMRLMFPVAGASAFLNNTPIVAALLPAVTEWARRNGKAASRFLIPLSYATIMGGTISLMGTSTNLVVTGMARKAGLPEIGLFDIAPVGLPVAVLGCATLVLVGPYLLPDRRPAVTPVDDPRAYTTELVVAAAGPLVGRTIEGAGLRNLPGAFLAEVARGGDVFPAVEPTFVLRGGDRLQFVGPRDAVMDVARVHGLHTVSDDAPASGGQRRMVEAVVGPDNALLGQTIRDGHFRSRYDAVVIAVARHGERLGGRLGDVVLRQGDVLLLETAPSWVGEWGPRRDFYLVSSIDDSALYRHEKAPIAVVLLAFVVGVAAAGWLGMMEASLLGAGAMLATRCMTLDEARQSIEWPVLVAIGASFALGEAIRSTGGGDVFAGAIASVGVTSPWLAMVLLYVGTAVLTELITNNAAAALMFPLGLALAERFGASPLPFVVAVMFAASASFSTPIGYQTNLMVFGPGGYKFTDFMRTGLILQVTCAIISCTLIPLVFPF